LKVRVCLVQMRSEKFNVKGNLDKVFKFLEDLGERFGIACLPELFNVGYLLYDRFKEFSEPIPGPTTKFLGELARNFSTHIVGGIAERDPATNDVYNSSVLIGPSGDLIGKHRKIFLPWPPNGMERTVFKPGNGVKVFDTRLGKIGLMICYEMAFPEVSRALALSGAELIVVSSAWIRVKDPPGRERVYDLAPICRAFENNLFIAISNMVGKDDGVEFQGRSKIIDPMGRVVVECSERDEGAIVKEIDMDLVGEVRRAVPYFSDSRDGIKRVWSGAKIGALR